MLSRTGAVATPDRIGLLLWGSVALVAGLAAAPLEPNVLEEGIVLHTAERMVQGDHLYRDIVNHTAPLPYEWLALLFRILGVEIWIARGAVVALQLLGTLASFAIARRAGAGALAHAAAAVVATTPILLIPLFSTYYYTTLAFYLGLAAVYAAVRATRPDAARPDAALPGKADRATAGWAVATGALLAAIALCKQSTGVACVATIVPALLATRPAGTRLRGLLQVSGGGAAVALATVALYALRGDLGDFAWSQVTLALRMGGATSFRTPFVNLWPPGRLDPVVLESWPMYLPAWYHMRFGLFTTISTSIVVITQALYALPFVALAATAARRLAGPLPPAVWLHAAFLATMTSNLYPRADWGHLVVALPPALLQLLLLAPGLTLRAPRATRALALALCLALVGSAAGAGRWLYEIAGEAHFGPRVPLRPISQAMRSPALPRVIHYLARRVTPGEPIFVARQEPLVYFATGTTNPTPFEGVFQGIRELQEPLVLEGLAAVRYVVMSDIDQPIYTYYSEELPAVWAYLERHFRIPAGFRLDDASWITVAERGPDRGETAIDLVATRETARPWQRGEDGRERAAGAAAPQQLASRQYRRPLPIALGAGGGGLDYDLRVPENAVLQADVGFRGLVSIDHQYIHPAGTRAVVALRAEGDETFESLASVAIDDRPAGGRRWKPIEVDLSAWAGRQVTLRLAFEASRPLGRERTAWFGSPRIALRR